MKSWRSTSSPASRRRSAPRWISIEEEFWGNAKINGNDTWLIPSYNVTPWFSASPFFCYGTDQPEHHLYREYRYGANLLFKKEIADWSFHWRTRWAMRDMESQERSFLHSRNRFHVRPPWSWTEYNIGPYAQYEFYFEDRPHYHGNDRFNGHRTFWGLSMDLAENVWFTLFYIRHWRRNGDEWRPQSIFGTGFYLTY